MAKPRNVIPDDPNPDDIGDEWVSEETDDKLNLICVSPRILSKEKALEYYNVDEKKWQIDKIQIRHYEMGSKVEAVQGGLKITRAMAVVPLHGIFVTCSRRTGWDDETFKDLVIEEFKRAAPKKLRSDPKIVTAGEILAVMEIYDAHIGKLGWEDEVLKNYDVEIARSRYMACFDRLLADALLLRPSRFLYVVGNDMLHVDTGKNQTTKGTSMDCDGRWQRSFLVAKRLILDTTARMREYAPVDILVVPGNHDEERMFCLGDSIESYFHNDAHVTVDNRAILQKAYQWGQVFLGFEHGHDIAAGDKRKLAPQTYMSRYPNIWAVCVHHEIHHGHIHTEREFRIMTASETIGDTIFRSVPSISGTDKWHFEKKYYSPLAAEVHLYDRRCRRGYFTWSPES